MPERVSEATAFGLRVVDGRRLEELCGMPVFRLCHLPVTVDLEKAAGIYLARTREDGPGRGHIPQLEVEACCFPIHLSRKLGVRHQRF